MHWLSFIIGFLTFPLLLWAGALVYAGVSRRLSPRGPSRKGTSLGFSSRLIGAIGEDIAAEAEPTAKAS